MMSVDLSTCNYAKTICVLLGGQIHFHFLQIKLKAFEVRSIISVSLKRVKRLLTQIKHTILQNSTNSKFVQHQMEWISCYLHFPSRESTKTEEGIFLPSLHAWMMVSAWNYGTYISGEQRQNFIRGESRGKTLVVLPKNLKVPICCGFLCGF